MQPQEHQHPAFEQVELRIASSRLLAIAGGRILMPMGLFGARRFSHLNQVIGAPDMYPTQYPGGATASGAAGPLDYRVAAVSLPVVNEHYTPKPSGYLRPLVGVGLSLGPSLHLGAAATQGPYLGEGQSAQMPVGKTWRDYNQTIVSGDVRFSRGYVETRGEVAWSRYEVPTASKPVHGLGAYVDARVTLSPRLFFGTRLEYNDYAFILPINPNFWVANATLERNAEVGAGYRISASWLVKASFRKDSWPLTPPPGVPLPDGYAAAVQLSWHAYPLDLLSPRY